MQRIVAARVLGTCSAAIALQTSGTRENRAKNMFAVFLHAHHDATGQEYNVKSFFSCFFSIVACSVTACCPGLVVVTGSLEHTAVVVRGMSSHIWSNDFVGKTDWFSCTWHSFF